MSDPTYAQEITLSDLEKSARQYSEAHDELRSIVRDLEDAIQAIKRARYSMLKRSLNKTADRQSALAALITSARHLFVKPRTITMHGVQFGFRKSKGTLDWEDTDQVVKLIRKHLPDQADVLIRTTETPNAKAIEQLPVNDLKRIGCTLTESSDSIVIKATDSELEKFVSKILEDTLEEMEVEPADVP